MLYACPELAEVLSKVEGSYVVFEIENSKSGGFNPKNRVISGKNDEKLS